MDLDDIIYLACLLSCIGFGSYYRKIKDDNVRKIVGTMFGVLIILIVSGSHIIHCLVSFWIAAIIITQIHPKQCHLVCFVFMFSYLIFFRTTSYFGIPVPPGHTNMIQMVLTLKIVGAAFEMNSAYNKILQRNRDLTSGDSQKLDDATKAIDITDYDMEIQKLDVTELFHYCFNYIGVLTGPYYRYRTYRDYFETPFKDYADCATQTTEKLKATTLYAVLYLITSNFWPLSYALDTEFYEARSFLYRLFYVWPAFVIFRMRIYTGLTLSECVCTNAGFGAYPEEANVGNGEGPKGPYLHFKRNPEKLRYNFESIKNIDVYNTETCWTFREAMKHWNKCVQYWLAVNVYKRYPNKKFRTLVTLLISSFWHGFYPGHYFCIMGAPFYVPVEDMYNSLLRKDTTGITKQIINVLFWISKFFAFSYLGISFQLLTFDKIWVYYSSVYHFGYLYYILLLVIGLLIRNSRKSSRIKKLQEEKDI